MLGDAAIASEIKAGQYTVMKVYGNGFSSSYLTIASKDRSSRKWPQQLLEVAKLPYGSRQNQSF